MMFVPVRQKYELRQRQVPELGITQTEVVTTEGPEL